MASKIKLDLIEAKNQLQHYKDYLEAKQERAFIRLKVFSKKIDALIHYEVLVEELNAKLIAAIEFGKNESSGIAYVLCKTPLAAYNILQNFNGRNDNLKSDK